MHTSYLEWNEQMLGSHHAAEGAGPQQSGPKQTSSHLFVFVLSGKPQSVLLISHKNRQMSVSLSSKQSEFNYSCTHKQNMRLCYVQKYAGLFLATNRKFHNWKIQDGFTCYLTSVRQHQEFLTKLKEIILRMPVIFDCNFIFLALCYQKHQSISHWYVNVS